MKPRTRFGINVRYAKRGSFEPEAVVFTRADWLLEEEGYNRGVKEPDSGKHLAEPDVANTRYGIRNKVKRNEKARNLLQFSAGRSSSLKTRKVLGATGAFKMKLKDGREVIMQRVSADEAGNVRRSKKGKALRPRKKGGATALIFKHALRTRVKVPRTMIFQKTAITMTKRHFGEYWVVNVSRALRTAKV